MKIELRSSTTTSGRRMAGARSLWRANGMKQEHFGRPVIAVVNSFSQFVPGHAHLHETGQYVKSIIEQNGCFAAEFNTIAIDDGIAMGHEGMLYSLPSRELIADSIEYVCNAHMADAMICISNCDKITPGMLMATMRLNIPTIFVTGGPMEAGRAGDRKFDLVDAMVMAGDKTSNDDLLNEIEENACPGCGSCSGMFTANSMNILTEVLGLALPGNGTILATHKNRLKLFEQGAKRIVDLAYSYYRDGDDKVLPRSVATLKAFINAMSVDIAMGGSTNTVLHLLAIANEAGVNFNMEDINRLSQKVPCICKVSPNSDYHIEDVNRAGGVFSIIGELNKADLIYTDVFRVDNLKLSEAIELFDINSSSVCEQAIDNCLSAPGDIKPNFKMASQSNRYAEPDINRETGCIRSVENAYSRDGGLAVLYGNIARDGCIVKTAGVDESNFIFNGIAKIFDSQEEACMAILAKKIDSGTVLVIRYEGPKGGPGMQEMLYPTSYLKSTGLAKQCALITDGRFSGGTSGLSIGHISPEAAAGGEIALIKDGDKIEINIPERMIKLNVTSQEIENRRKEEINRGKSAFTPINRKREISKALKSYALCASSANKGGVREIPE